MNSSRAPRDRFKKAKQPKYTTVSTKIEMSLLEHVYSQAKVGFLASLFCATVIFVGMYSSQIKENLYIWFGSFVLITLARLIIVNFYMSAQNPELRLPFWRNMFTLSSFAGGVSWGLTAILVYPYVTNVQQTLIVLVVAGITAGAIPLFSAILSAAVAFTVMTLLPLILTLLFIEQNYLFDSTVFAYMIYLVIIARNTHKIIQNSISLQFENHALLANLSQAKSQLEIINQKLEQAASHDPLTNVANRNLFITNFSEAIDRAKQNKKMVALLFIDLDNFKNVNDIYGHHIGDQLLLILVDRIEQIIEDFDRISRLGGDEFTVILEDIKTPQDISVVAEKIRETLILPITIKGVDISVSASIGISIYPLDGDNAERLLNVADQAMYYVKEHGGNNFRFNVTLLSDN